MKTKKLIVMALIGLSMLTLPDTIAKAATKSTTTPSAIRGTFYRYSGHHQWDKLKITKHTATLSGPDYGKKTISSKYKLKRNKLVYKYTGTTGNRKYFSLQYNLSNTSSSVFPEGGMSLTYRKIAGKKYKVIRGYQAGYWFDFIKGHKVTHRYEGRSTGNY